MPRSIEINGTVYEWCANTPRIDGQGCLVEPAVTNLIYPSVPLLSGTSTSGAIAGEWIWTVSAAGGSINGGAVAAPDGSMTGTSFVNGTAQVQISASGTAVGTPIYTASFWARGAVGGEVITPFIYDNTTSTMLGGGTGVTLTTAWTRYVVTATLAPANGDSIRFLAINSGSSPQTVYLWGCQCETTGFATSYIPNISTTATAAAATDTITIPSGMLQAAAGSFSCDAVLNNTAMAANGLFYTGGATALSLGWASGTSLAAALGATAVSAAETRDTAAHHYGISWRQSGTGTVVTVYLDRVQVASQTVAATTVSPGTVVIGSDGTHSWNGHIKNVRLSADPVAAL